MPASLRAPGVYVEEIPSGARAVTGVATSITAFVGRGARGPENEPTSVYSYADYERAFGGLWSESPMSYAVQQFFLNGGGEALVVRVAHADAVPAAGSAMGSLVLRATAAATGAVGFDHIAVTVAAGVDDDHFDVHVAVQDGGGATIDDGGPLEETIAGISATAAPADPDSVESRIGAAQFVELVGAANLRRPADTTAAVESVGHVASLPARNSRLTLRATAAAKALADFHHLEVVLAHDAGSAKACELTVDVRRMDDSTIQSSTIAVDLGRPAVAQAAIEADPNVELDGALPTVRPDADTVATAGEPHEVVFDAEALRIRATPEAAAVAGFTHLQVVVADGDDPAHYALTLTAAGGAGASETLQVANDARAKDAVQHVLAGATYGRLAASAGTRPENTAGVSSVISPEDHFVGLEGSVLSVTAANVGTWGNRLEIGVEHPAAAAGDAFTFIVRELDGSGAEVASEVHYNASLDSGDARYLPRLLESSGSRARIAGLPRAGRPDAVAAQPLRDGTDGSDVTPGDLEGSEGAKTGMYALEKADLFNLLCFPMATWSPATIGTLWDSAATYCARKRAFLLVDPPDTWTTAANPDLSQVPSSKNAAVYYPALRMADPLKENRPRDFPPCGAIAGLIARTDGQRGVWKAPAGTEARLAGVRGLAVPLNDSEQGKLNQVGINCVRTFPVYGSVVWGARTLKGADVTASEWKYVPVRRLALFLEESLYRGSHWAVFEPNDEPLWGQLRLNLGSFMHQLFRQGAFQGSKPAEAYFVRCDGSTTTQADIDRGIVNVIVGFAPLKPAEFVIIQIQQMAGQAGA